MSTVNSASSYLVFFGVYGDSIYVSRFDSATGTLSEPAAYAAGKNPSFLALHPRKSVLYAVGEVGEGVVSAFAVNPKTGALSPLNKQPTQGAPCYVSVDKTGKCVLAANYGGGSVAIFPVRADGSVGAGTVKKHSGKSVNTSRQEAPHAHIFLPDPRNRFAHCCDLGIDKVVSYPLQPLTATLGAPHTVNLAPGAGPRHLAFAQSSRFAYVVNELDLTVTAFTYDALLGKFQTLQTITTMPEGASRENVSCADIHLHPNGRFLYASNRVHDSIALFGVDGKTGKLTAIGHVSTGGKVPRNFNLTPDGAYLLAANQESDNVVVFRVDGETGQLTPTGHELRVPKPVCVLFK